MGGRGRWRAQGRVAASHRNRRRTVRRPGQRFTVAVAGAAVAVAAVAVAAAWGWGLVAGPCHGRRTVCPAHAMAASGRGRRRTSVRGLGRGGRQSRRKVLDNAAVNGRGRWSCSLGDCSWGHQPLQGSLLFGRGHNSQSRPCSPWARLGCCSKGCRCTELLGRTRCSVHEAAVPLTRGAWLPQVVRRVSAAQHKDTAWGIAGYGRCGLSRSPRRGLSRCTPCSLSCSTLSGLSLCSGARIVLCGLSRSVLCGLSRRVLQGGLRLAPPPNVPGLVRCAGIFVFPRHVKDVGVVV